MFTLIEAEDDENCGGEHPAKRRAIVVTNYVSSAVK